MNSMTFESPQVLWLMLALPIVALFMAYRWYNAVRAFRSFDETGKRLSVNKQVGSLVCTLIGTFLMILALARPAWDPHPKEFRQQGRDIIFALDVSKSMLAPDVLPNRLANAKQAILDCVEGLGGDRVGLIVFGGTTSIKCPLTSDYDYFKNVLREISWNSVHKGGTFFYPAINKIIDNMFSFDSPGTQDLILISDGVTQGKEIKEGAKRLNEKGVRLIIMGLGDSRMGSRIPDPNTKGKSFIQEGDREVWSRLDTKSLSNLAKMVQNSVFLNVGTKTVRFAEVYKQIVANDPRKIHGDTTVMVLTPKFHLFVLPAIIFLLAARLLQRKIRRSVAALLVILCSFNTYAATDQEIADENAAEEAATTLQIYIPEDPYEAYNLGHDYYEDGEEEHAMQLFEAVAIITEHRDLQIKSYYNLATILLKQVEEARKAAPEAALSILQNSIEYYQILKKIEPRHYQALYNLEIARVTERELVKEIEENKEKNKDPLKKLVEEVLAQLDSIIKEESKLLIISTKVKDRNKNERPRFNEDEHWKPQDQLRIETETIPAKLTKIDSYLSQKGKLEQIQKAIDTGKSLDDIVGKGDKKLFDEDIIRINSYVLNSIKGELQTVSDMKAHEYIKVLRLEKNIIELLTKAAKELAAKFAEDQDKQEGDENEEPGEEEEAGEPDDQDGEGDSSDEPGEIQEDQEITSAKETPEEVLKKFEQINSIRKNKKTEYIETKKDY